MDSDGYLDKRTVHLLLLRQIKYCIEFVMVERILSWRDFIPLHMLNWSLLPLHWETHMLYLLISLVLFLFTQRHMNYSWRVMIPRFVLTSTMTTFCECENVMSTFKNKVGHTFRLREDEIRRKRASLLCNTKIRSELEAQYVSFNQIA